MDPGIFGEDVSQSYHLTFIARALLLAYHQPVLAVSGKKKLEAAKFDWNLGELSVDLSSFNFPLTLVFPVSKSLPSTETKSKVRSVHFCIVSHLFV